MVLPFTTVKLVRILSLPIIERKIKMTFETYHMKKIALIDVDDDVFVGTSYFCDKEDYDADEDGLEMVVNGDVIIY